MPDEVGNSIHREMRAYKWHPYTNERCDNLALISSLNPTRVGVPFISPGSSPYPVPSIDIFPNVEQIFCRGERALHRQLALRRLRTTKP
jgi:hypothetical protein